MNTVLLVFHWSSRHGSKHTFAMPFSQMKGKQAKACVWKLETHLDLQEFYCSIACVSITRHAVGIHSIINKKGANQG